MLDPLKLLKEKDPQFKSYGIKSWVYDLTSGMPTPRFQEYPARGNIGLITRLGGYKLLLYSLSVVKSKILTSMDESSLRSAIKKLPAPLEEGRHKGEAGRIGIIGGSREYTGAPYFAGISGLRCGADLVYVFCMKDAAVPIKSFCPELIVLPYLDEPNGFASMVGRLQNVHSLVIGPGLGENAEVHKLIVSLIEYMKTCNTRLSKISLVFDADGIGLVCKNKEILRDYLGQVYLTPNANEIRKLASAFLGRDDVNVQDATSLRELVGSINANAVVILKGVEDKIITGDDVKYCSAEGSLRRVGGQGDLLSGSLGLFAHWANLYEQKADGSDDRISGKILAAYTACYVTRMCSKYAFDQKKRSMITSDMITQIGIVCDECFKNS